MTPATDVPQPARRGVRVAISIGVVGPCGAKAYLEWNEPLPCGYEERLNDYFGVFSGMSQITT